MLENKTHAGASQFGTQGLGAGGGTILPEKGASAIKRPPAGVLRVRPLNLEANGNMPSYSHGSWQVKIIPVLLLSSLYKEILDVTLPRICLERRWRRG